MIVRGVREEAARFAQALANASVVNDDDDGINEEFSVEARIVFWDYLNKLFHNGGTIPYEDNVYQYYLPWAEVASMLLNGE